jgi:hypothetical protein
MNSHHFARYCSFEIKYKDYDRLQQVCLGLAETDTMVNLVTLCGVSSAVSWVYIHFDRLHSDVARWMTTEFLRKRLPCYM